MKNTRRSSTEKIHNLWKGLTSVIKDKIKINGTNISNSRNAVRDMGDTHTPVSRLDLTGMNREQAKELIGRIIDEKLKMISSIELTEPEIDYSEKERLRAKAAERINQRRNRRKNRKADAVETIITDQGVYSDYKHASVFDMIQPESFPFEENVLKPIEGQLSILDVVLPAEKKADVACAVEFGPSFDMDRITSGPSRGNTAGETTLSKILKFFKKKDAMKTAADPELFKPHGFDLFGIFPYGQDKETAADVTAIETGIAEAEVIETNDVSIAAIETDCVEAVTMATDNVETAADVTAIETGIAEAAAIETDGVEAAAARAAAGKVSAVQINTSFDEAIDKVFLFYYKNKERLLSFFRRVRHKASGVLNGKVLPALSLCMSCVGRLLRPLILKAGARLQIKNKAAGLQAALSEQEKEISEKMARFVEALDKMNEAFLRGVITVKDKTCRCVNRVRDFAETHKKGLLIELGIGVAAIVAVTLTIGNATAYEYVYNGKVLGVVKNQEDVYRTIDIIGDKLSAQYDADITIDKNEDIRFNKIVLALNQDVDDKEDILNRLTYMRDMKANGKGIYVNGELMAVLESEKTAKQILNEIQNEFLKQDPGIEYEKIGFAESIEIKDVETKLGDIEARDKVLEYMMTGAMEQKIHVVQSGETFSEIAKMYDLKQSELQVTNPEVIPEKLHIGQEICLNRIVPLVTVQTTEIAQYTEEIPFDIAYENTSSLYKNEQTVKSKGIKGEKDVVAEIVRNNGIEVSRNELSATILSQPVSQVVLVGTKEPPPLIGTGTFIYPIRGTLTSRYGTRWGRLHAGIDLAAPIGTHIKASDGGKVTFAGYNGALGYMVEIDHGGGRVTWYGHCSKLFVKKGDKVYQGQHIANVGNTGRSTGPHVHFEVHINGKTKNPLNYL